MFKQLGDLIWGEETGKEESLQDDMKQAQLYTSLGKKYANNKPSLGTHFYVLALETLMARRNEYSTQERAMREGMAAQIMGEAKATKGVVNASIQQALTSPFNKEIYSCLVQDPNQVKFADIAGLETAKQIVYESLVYPSRRPDIFTGLRAPTKGILLYGPPGNGKTMVARAIACEAGFKFYNFSAGTLLSKFVGESEKLVKALFSMARMTQPSVIFIDEIDSILSQRSSGEQDHVRKVKNEFLIQFEGVASSGEDWVFVVAATNRPYDLDSAVLRRFVE